MLLTQAQIADYDRDGYLLVPDLFRPEEVQSMIGAIADGGRVAQHAHGMSDASGRAAKLALWTDIGDDIWGAATVCPRLLDRVEILLRDKAVFFHGKVMLKEAHSGGAWEWHQDYGYWYGDGYVYPNLISVFVALDPATVENGCLQVLRGSHQVGRIEHGAVSGQTGADANRMAGLEKILDRIHCEMTPGAALFFHGNLLHTSAPNESDHHRRAFIVCFNALGNPRLVGPGFGSWMGSEEVDGIAVQRPVRAGADDALSIFAVKE